MPPLCPQCHKPTKFVDYPKLGLTLLGIVFFCFAVDLGGMRLWGRTEWFLGTVTPYLYGLGAVYGTYLLLKPAKSAYLCMSCNKLYPPERFPDER